MVRLAILPSVAARYVAVKWMRGLGVESSIHTYTLNHSPPPLIPTLSLQEHVGGTAVDDSRQPGSCHVLQSTTGFSRRLTEQVCATNVPHETGQQ